MRKAEKLIFTLLLTVLPCLGLNAQTRQFVGKITDSTDGSPLTGVAVINENRSTSAQTITIAMDENIQTLFHMV